MHIERDDILLKTMVSQVIVGLCCLLIGAPVAWGLAILAENLAINYLGVNLSGLGIDATLGKLLAYFSPFALLIIIIIVTDYQVKYNFSPDVIVKQTFKATLNCGIVIVSIPAIVAANASAWDALAFSLITGLVVMFVIGVIVAAIQAGQYRLDPAGYTERAWFMSNQGALAACKNDVLPFQYRLLRAWNLVAAVIALLACIVVPFLLWSGVWALDAYDGQRVTCLSMAALLIVLVRIVDLYRQLYRAQINSIEGEIEKTMKKRWDGRARCRVRITKTWLAIDGQTWRQLENGESYRLFIVSSHFMTSLVWVVAFERV